MKKNIFLALAVASLSITPLWAQNQTSTGDLYQGMSRAVPQGRVVIPYGLEVTYEKTVHLIFPSKIRYVDLGSRNIMASQAGDAENVLRVKAAMIDFETETNLGVICEDGSYYSFNVKYAEEPEKLSIEMKDFLSSDGNNLPTNRADIYFKELGKEAPLMVKLMMQTIYKNDKRYIKHIGERSHGIEFSLQGLYAHNGLLYFHMRGRNKTNMNYETEFVTFKVVDKEVSKRTAIQEHLLQPLRTLNATTNLLPGKTQKSIYVLEQFTLPDDKRLEVTVYEKGGNRNLTFYMENEDIVRAESIKDLKLKLK